MILAQLARRVSIATVRVGPVLTLMVRAEAMIAPGTGRLVAVPIATRPIALCRVKHIVTGALVAPVRAEVVTTKGGHETMTSVATVAVMPVVIDPSTVRQGRGVPLTVVQLTPAVTVPIPVDWVAAAPVGP